MERKAKVCRVLVRQVGLVGERRFESVHGMELLGRSG